MGLVEYGGARPDTTKKTLHNNGANLTPSSSLQILLNYLPCIVGALNFVFRGFQERISDVLAEISYQNQKTSEKI